MITKNVLVLVVLLAGFSRGQGQEQFTMTHLTRVPQASNANPALAPAHLQYFAGVPLLSGFQLYGYGQGFNLGDLGIDNMFDPQLNYRMAAQRTSAENVYRFGGALDLLYGGIAIKSGLLTFNFTERLVGETILPHDFFRRLAEEEQGLGEVIEGGQYDLSKLSGQAFHFKELGLGYASQKRKGVNWGIRLKFLLGHEAIYSDNQGLMLRQQGEGNLSASGDFAFRTSGFRHFSSQESFYQLFSAQNAGVALDGGFHYRYDKRWEFFASFRDLGGITWRKSLNLRDLPETFPDVMSEIDRTFDILVNDIHEMPQSFRTALPVQLRAGMRYHLKNQHRLSALAATRFYPSGADLGLSVAYYVPATEWLEWTASYSIFNKSFANFGAGMAVQVGKVQLYFASDNLLSVLAPTDMRTFQFQSGVNLVWAKPDKKRRPTANRETLGPEDPMVAPAGNDTPEAETSYFTLSSRFVSAAGRRQVNAIYVDIYRYDAQGNKQLIHTSRYPSDQFEVTLYRIASLHEMAVKAYGFEPLIYQFFPESEGLDREFTLKEDPAAGGK